MALERSVFASDQLSRRSMRRLLQSPTGAVLVLEEDGRLGGAAVLLFRTRSAAARLYSIAVAPQRSRHGLGAMLLEAAEAAAVARGCRSMRLEVHAANAAAIARRSGRQYVRRVTHSSHSGDGYSKAT
jgi:ribosomal protein S18 acetylase RimI-like enzyme